MIHQESHGVRIVCLVFRTFWVTDCLQTPLRCVLVQGVGIVDSQCDAAHVPRAPFVSVLGRGGCSFCVHPCVCFNMCVSHEDEHEDISHVPGYDEGGAPFTEDNEGARDGGDDKPVSDGGCPLYPKSAAAAKKVTVVGSSIPPLVPLP